VTVNVVPGEPFTFIELQASGEKILDVLAHGGWEFERLVLDVL
jgi:hypothetical protein